MSGQSLRIVHVFRAPLGGLFRHVADLAAEQVRNGQQVGLVCDSTGGGAREADVLRALSDQLPLGVLRIPMRRTISLQDIATAQQALAHIDRLGPDVIHGHGAKGGVYARLIGAWLGIRREVARVYTPHGGSLHYEPASLAGKIYFNAERALESVTDAIVHVSRFEADAYRRKIRPPRCAAHVIPNGLQAEEFTPVAPGSDARDLLFLGEFRDLKGIDVLIDALALLRARGLRVTANLVGPVGGRAPYAARAETLGLSDQVAFLDPMPARAAFATARAIVVPSRAESLPYVVLEAIAAQLPIIASNVGGIPEILGPFAGDLVPPGDVGALADAVAALLADPAQAAAAAQARLDWMGPRFRVETMGRDIMAVYREALERRARHRTGAARPRFTLR